MDKQTFFENPHVLENAQVMLDVCREEYARAGHGDAFQMVRGLDVTSLESARIALLSVQNVPSYPELDDIRKYTIHALATAINSMRRTQRLAG